MLDVADMTRLSELAKMTAGATEADYHLVARRLADLEDERRRLNALRELIRVQLNLDRKN